MKKLIKILIIAVFIFNFIPNDIFGMTSTKENLKEFKVGAAIALTGWASSFGESEKNAIIMLREKYDAEGVKFFVEDNKSKPKDGLAAVNKLLNINNVNMVYCDLTTVANAINPILKRERKIHLACVYLRTLLDNNKYAIRNLPDGLQESGLLLDYLNKKGIKLDRVALLISNDEFGNSSAVDLREATAKYGHSIIYKEVIPDLNILKSEITKLLSKKPTVVYIGSLLSHVGNCIKELRIQGYTGEIITNDNFPYPYVLNPAGKYAKGTTYVAFKETEKLSKFKEAYKAKFNKDLVTTAVLAHDGISFILDLIKQSGSQDLDSFFEFISDKTFDGSYGKMVLKGRKIIYPMEVKVWQ